MAHSLPETWWAAQLCVAAGPPPRGARERAE